MVALVTAALAGRILATGKLPMPTVSLLHVDMLVRLIIATALGALVGYERDRTHGMVALGAALFTLVSTSGFSGAHDPARVAAQIVTGIGFVGAGAILHMRRSVQGLTTAASLWVTAAIGLAVGVGMLAMSAATAVLVFLLLRFGPRPRPKTEHLDRE